MISREQIPHVLDQPVLDGTGSKIGEVKHVFLDDATGRPEWVSVKTGFFGSRESFIPIQDASLVEDHLEVPYTKDRVKESPHVAIEGGGHLSASEEHRLYDYYGIDWSKALGEPSTTGTTGGTTGTAETAGTTGAAGLAGDTDTAGRASGAEASAAGRRQGPAEAFREMGAVREKGRTGRTGAVTGEPTETGRAGDTGTARAKGKADAVRGMGTTAGPSERTSAGAAAGTAAGKETGTGYFGTTSARERERGVAPRAEEEAMTLSEERMKVNLERHEVGRARLRKYVVTEDVEQTVPVRHDEVFIEHEPITEANRGAALSGKPLSEAEHEVTLYEDQPVVETEVVPVERVRLRTEEHVEDRTVKGRIRKERIESEGVTDNPLSSGSDTEESRRESRRGT